ncbi:hypothetical protein PICMEDRAFT_47269 [Pichia membranifaciens NRRL Y-2026]|uniref:Uncharacterized protein n=1 Tax=Pichia membranifaciens NRRL Y-2026 TaxID=763406 RepID=A0A1E3NQF9_9ASCO|nr:hypothetical protein PICMEDRAFT_47269 [Pichia membranifaciens NRRL Y-2026]ODQ48305.1 hypothetical protein PICMEDRAFT_47269 [Pichia membranifaciens NRRL Y-2026]
MVEKLSWDLLGKKEHPVLSAAYMHNDLVFTSGRVGVEADGSYSTCVLRQTELAIKELEKVLEAAGSSLDCVLKVLLFIKNPEDREKINTIYAKYMKTKPARSCVSVTFPDARVLLELECVAVRKSKAKL